MKLLVAHCYLLKVKILPMEFFIYSAVLTDAELNQCTEHAADLGFFQFECANACIAVKVCSSHYGISYNRTMRIGQQQRTVVKLRIARRLHHYGKVSYCFQRKHCEATLWPSSSAFL